MFNSDHSGGSAFTNEARFFPGRVSSQLRGGTQSTNATRYAALMPTHPPTGEVTPLEKIQGHSDNGNNFQLQANEAIACYDFDVTNFRDIFQTIEDILHPLNFLFGANCLLTPQ